MIDAGRDQRRVLLLQLFNLHAGVQAGLPFDHHVKRVGPVQAAALFGLRRLQAEQVTDKARPVEQGQADGTFT